VKRRPAELLALSLVLGIWAGKQIDLPAPLLLAGLFAASGLFPGVRRPGPKTALLALGQIMPKEKLRSTLARHFKDPSSRVRQFANWLAERKQIPVG